MWETGGCLTKTVLLLEGPEVLCGGGAGGLGRLEKVVGLSSVVTGIGGGGCLKGGGGRKEGKEVGRSFGCSMNSRGCTRAIGDDDRTSSSVVLEIVEKFV